MILRLLCVVCLHALLLSDHLAATTTPCSSCADCTSKLKGAFSKVTLANDLSSTSTDCVVVGAPNVELDCQGKSIQGSGSHIGITNNSHDNVTIRQCKLSKFAAAIDIRSAANNLIIGNTVTDTAYGVQLENITGSKIQGNTIRLNHLEALSLLSSTNDENKIWFLQLGQHLLGRSAHVGVGAAQGVEVGGKITVAPCVVGVALGVVGLGQQKQDLRVLLVGLL
ncbi:MAG: hypothetical protein GY769_08855 [bacterium]|nr:hypothetical protein [bacterium]